MLKHCQATAADSRRSRRSLNQTNDSVSINSSNGNSFNSSFGSDSSSSSSQGEEMVSWRLSSSTPEPMLSIASRASSFASLSLDSSGPKTPIKVYANCLRPDIEYKTLSIGYQTTCKDLIWMLLSKYKMKHRDPNLFYLTMDISIKRTGIPLQRTLVLEDESKPAELKLCHPWGECKFSLQMRKGGLVRIHDSILMAESKYKCLLIAEHTTVQDVIRILFHCYGVERLESVDRFCIYEQCQSQSYERRLHPQDRPAQVQSLWPNQSQFHFVLRREMPKSVSPVNSAGVSPVNSDIETMDVSYSSSVATPTPPPPPAPPVVTSQAFFASSPVKNQPNRSTPSTLQLPPRAQFRLNGQVSTSIHQSGLPPPPALRPKPPQTQSLMLQLANNRASLGSLSSGSRSSFHDYENYFYI